VTEQLAFHEGSDKRGAVNHHEWPGLSSAVDCLGDEFLPRAGFAQDQDGPARASGLLDLIENVANPRRTADQGARHLRLHVVHRIIGRTWIPSPERSSETVVVSAREVSQQGSAKLWRIEANHKGRFAGRAQFSGKLLRLFHCRLLAHKYPPER